MTLIEGSPTAEEDIKRSSDFLRGDLSSELATSAASVSGSSELLPPFHVLYSHYNRDVRRERSLAGESLEYIFMVRVAIPGGKLSTDQWLALDQVAGDVADGTVRLTTRQAVQFHGVLKQGLRPMAYELDAHLMTSFGACGDVVRNTVMCPSLISNPSDHRMLDMADRIARTFKPTTNAHWEIFVNGDKSASREFAEEHEFYGSTYLPRKFKIAIAHPLENCVDVLAQDLGLIPAVHETLGEGFNVVVAGGLGRSYAQPDTFARLADPLTFVTYEELNDVIRAVLATYRDLGDRTNRRRARMKYVAADMGFAAFRASIEERYGRPLREALPTCSQALGEAERKLPDLVSLVQSELDSNGLTKRRLQLRMTGCPNGCARPAVAEVGVVGRTKNTYDLYLGGGPRGDRLASLYQEKVKLDDIPGVLRPLLERWKSEGLAEESFGDFFVRVVDQ